MGGPGSGRKPSGGKWTKKTADKDMKRLVKMRIRKAPSKYPHISGHNVQSKQIGANKGWR
jgi:hypothetical protein